MPAETFARIKKLVDGEKMIVRALHFARDTTVTIPGICSVATCYGDKNKLCLDFRRDFYCLNVMSRIRSQITSLNLHKILQRISIHNP